MTTGMQMSVTNNHLEITNGLNMCSEYATQWIRQGKNTNIYILVSKDEVDSVVQWIKILYVAHTEVSSQRNIWALITNSVVKNSL